jgi:xanthine/uracil/vitamin C permease (AzgA family)
MKRLVRGLLAAPYGTIRNTFLNLAFICLVSAIATAITAKWPYVLGFGSGFVVLLVFALIDQHESEVSGKVERERERQAEVFAKRATWPAWKRRLFYGSFGAVIVAVNVWRLMDGR